MKPPSLASRVALAAVAAGVAVVTALATTALAAAPSLTGAPRPAAVAAAQAYAAWAPNVSYKVGDRVTYNGTDYECIQAHTSLTGWEPPNVPALWKPVGTSTPTTSPTTSPTPTPTGTPPAVAMPVAPYVDMGAWPTPSLTEMSAASGLKSFTLAFITGAACKASWFGAYDPRQAWAKDQIDAVRAAGGQVKVSFGGASGVELAQGCSDVTALYSEYKAVVDAYRLTYIDLDIEGAAQADAASVARRSQALARLQQTYPALKISLTLPVLPEGLTADGLAVVRSARDAGVNLDLVNVMAMDYYRNADYGDAAVQAATSTFNQLKSLYSGKSDAQLWRMVGVTPMVGQNDDGRIYNQDDARQLVTFARSKHLGTLAFWELTRDRNACNGALYKCTNIPQAPYDFAKIFVGYTG
ncbi:carbohydrate-binding protein [Nonomuraea sediminis]|uniref:carbohydrate-binding protein n=1 Tax=Nonomuraea sediminis TaxID=2835864 RepID=UPI001BDD6D5D|nr:carbohydrate-binding protein [Nonomuraea sediminis]